MLLAAAKEGICYAVSTVATRTMEDIADAGGPDGLRCLSNVGAVCEGVTELERMELSFLPHSVINL